MIVCAFAAGICSISVTGFAQKRVVQKKIPEGKWVLEREIIHAFIIDGVKETKGNVNEMADRHDHDHHSHDGDKILNINNIDIELYTELEVKKDSIILKSSKNTMVTKYVYDNRRGIQYDAHDFPFLPGGNVFGNNLYVQQRIDNHSLDTDNSIFISFSYAYKKDEK